MRTSFKIIPFFVAATDADAEMQIRRKLKADIFDVKILEETVRVLPVILLDYSKVLFELLDSFVRDKNAVISNFANVGYR